MIQQRLSLIQYPLTTLNLPGTNLLICFGVISHYSLCQKLR
jgi:hypothetical protein